MKAAWPAVLERVLQARRFSWILLSQNAEPVEARDDMLTLGFSNPGARDSYMSGGSQQLLSQALATVTGQRWRINAIVVGPDAASRQQRPSEPTIDSRADAGGGEFQPVQGSQASSSPPPMAAPTTAVGGDGLQPAQGSQASSSPHNFVATQLEQAAAVPPAQTGVPPAASSFTSADDDPGVSADDETIDDNTDTASLLSSALGAELIAEESDDV